jgi:hypothetical protein
MTQYLLSVHHAEDAFDDWTDEQQQQVFADTGKVNEEMQAEGAWVFAGGLQPVAQATTVDNTGDAPIVSDGPYAESKEYLGGFWIIEAPDLDAALDWARRGSKACQARIEVRPFQSEPA